MRIYLLGAVSLFSVLLLHSAVSGDVNLDITDVRLVNGSGSFGGRVEVSINGVWGTFCDDSFDIDDAKVICRMLNLSASAFATKARFGQGTGPIFAQEVMCAGHESHLKDCTFNTSGLCSHDQDVGVFCTECSEVNITYGEGYSVSTDGSEMTISCYRGFHSDINLTVCQDERWTPSSITCVPDGIQRVRLEDGLGLYDGRVELLVNNTWGTVCGEAITYGDVRAICNVLFGTRYFNMWYTTSTLYEDNAVSPVINQLGCGGYETDLNECDYKRNGTCSQKYLAIVCYKYPQNITDIRLVNGTGPYDGRVELMVDGHWGTVCNKDIGLYDAMTLCNMLNLSLATYFNTIVYGEGTGPLLFRDIYCRDSARQHINNCSYTNDYATVCDHTSDLSIVCTACGPPNIINGDGISFNGHVLTVKCQTGYTPEEITMTCIENGTWAVDQTCTPKYDFPLRIEGLRLAGSSRPSEGRVEVLINDTWGTICAKNVVQTGAAVLCNMLGLTYVRHYVKAQEDYLYGIGSGPIYIDELQCNGTEGHINSCTYDLSNSCTHYDDLALVCTDGIQRVRLEDGLGLYDGRVELLVNNTWGTVCGDAITYGDVPAICNVLFGTRGYYTWYTTSTLYEDNAVSPVINQLGCGGYETDLNECNFKRYDTCSQKYLAIVCYNYPLNITDIRLVNGTGPYDGRVELMVDGHWGTICNKDIGLYDAMTLCNMLNLSLATYCNTTVYGEGTGPLLIRDIYCRDSARQNINNCSYTNDLSTVCDHTFDLSIVCTACGPPNIINGDGVSFNGRVLTVKCQTGYAPEEITMTCLENGTWATDQTCTPKYDFPLRIEGLRLAGSSRPSEGRVEVLINDTWGTICAKNVVQTGAAVLCNMLGLTYVRHYVKAQEDYLYGIGSGPIYIDELQCNGTEGHINSCTYDLSNSCTHYDDLALVCTDGIQRVRLEDGLGLYDGRVELLVNNTWGTVCGDAITYGDVPVICNVLFGTRYYYTWYTTSTLYEDNAVSPVINQLGCGGYETDLNECNYKRYGTCSQKYLAIVCYNYPLNITDIRLVNGTGPYDGRVELMVDGHWGTICNKDIGLYDAMTLCNMLNLSLATYFNTTMYGEGTGPLLIRDIYCRDSARQHINNCSYRNDLLTVCDHTFDLSIVCTACGPPNIINGDGVSFNGRVLTVKCQTGYAPEETTLTCFENGTWATDQTCTPKYDFPLRIEGLRLAGSSRPSEGRVEVLINNTWGTVCAKNVVQTGAAVLCNMLGLAYVRHYLKAQEDYLYGIGSGPIYIDELKCNGTEGHINNCTYDLSNSCTHYDDLALVCTDGIQRVRLEDGLGLYDGRVKLLVNNTWGAVCGDAITDGDVIAICNVLFGTRFYYTWYSTSTLYEDNAVSPVINQLGCGGYETDLNECDYKRYGTCSQKYLAIVCFNYPLNITDIRLVNGTGPYDGRVELMVDGHWGTICNKDIGLYDAMTLCNMLNLSLATYFNTTVYGEGTGPLLIRDIYCRYSAIQHINNCYYENDLSTVCDHTSDLSIVCTACGPPNIINGDGVSFNGRVLTVKCQTGYAPDEITMTCLENGTWATDQTCTPKYEFPLNIEGLRLAGSNWPSEGRVEVLINNTWGTICASNFVQAGADVLCNMLGLTYVTHYVKAREDYLYGIGSGPIYIDELQCNGTEGHINNCTYDLSNSCTHYDDLALICTGYQLTITGIRLAGTPGPYHGRVEILVNGTWGTISDTFFNSTEASVVCNMLGLRYWSYNGSSYYGPGTGPNFIHKLHCYSYYSHINDCKYVVDLETNKLHTDDASVICYGPTLNITGARLADGTGPFEGRAEIKVNDTWGTICDNNFDIRAADLFCKILGLRAVEVFTGAVYGEGSGPIFMDQVFCETYNTELKYCRYLYLNSCSHEMDVSVVCNECGEPDVKFWSPGYSTFNGSTLYADCSSNRNYIGTLKMTCDNNTKSWITDGECQEYSYPLDIADLRLADGPSTSSGRVEVKSLDTWGTVCDHAFGMSEANVVCQMLGFAPAVTFYTRAHYGEGKGPIFIDDLSCNENATDLNDCTYVTYDNCTHGEDVSVVCTGCGDPTPENGFIKTLSSSNGTVVHITCEPNYALVGESDIFCQLNGSWSGEVMCKAIDCGDATPEHGFSNTTVTKNGTVVAISCREGYNISGEAVITCQDNEKWTDYPSCEIIDCKEPDPKNAEVTLTNNKTTFGQTAVIKCQEGYTSSGVGSPTVSCLADGTWEEWTDCVPIDCGSPVPTKGSANTTSTVYNTVVKISCQTNYNITGNSVITCQADGTWSDTPVCDISDCGVLSIPNGEANTTLGTSTGALATIKCDEGYSLNGSPVVICTTNGWNDSLLACNIQHCDDPTPNNGKITSTDGSDGYIFGSYAEIDCYVGYELTGDKVISCEDGGMWSDRPSCEIKDCGNLSAPAGGSIDDSKGTKYQAQIAFSCNEGYLLDGEEKTFCNEQGEWTNPTPKCIKKSDVGETCTSDEYCLFEDSKCENSICTCITGIYDKTSKKCDIMPLLPYGPSEGDLSLPKGQRCSANISFELGFPAFDKMYKDVFVCWYGYLTLDTVYANPSPPIDKNGISGFDRKKVLAPFNAPISIKNSAAVFYRSFNIRNSYEKMKENVELISYIEMIVRKFGNKKSFDVNFGLVVTWDKARPLPGFDRSKSSTFQAVLTSDGKTTFVFYIYGHGKMQWVNKQKRNPRVWVGYKVDRVAYNHPYSFSNSVLQLDSKLSLSKSENDVWGLVFQPLTKPGQIIKNYAVDCVKWYKTHYEDKKDLDYIASMIPECPCDIWLSRFDPWFWRIRLQRRRTDITHACVDMLQAGIFGHYGKRCCYDLRTGLWVSERPYAGGFQLYNTRFPLQYILNDVIPKAKCCNESDYCNLYYELRPTGSCYKTSPYDFGTFWGDPHFRTLDGLNFTFNGLGEYILLQVRGNKTFDLHARTERPVKKDGSLSEATVFTAFAAKDSTNASVHVELNRNKTGIILYGNKVDLTILYYESDDTEDPFEWTSDEDNLIISKRDETLSVLFPSFGISLNISVSLEMLSLVTLVNKTLRGHTQGLLGNYNGNPDDDFTFPNGTILSANLTERDVFKYGKTWAVDTNNSAFIYEKGKSHTDYHNDSYVPRFLDEADQDKVDEAITVCNGSQNIQCVFDLVFIDKPEVALMTNTIKSESESTRSELDESVPSISGCETVKALKGETATCTFDAQEDNDVYFLENNVNATIDRTSSVVKFILKNEDPTQIRIASINEKGRNSNALVIDVLLCSKCNNHGNCTDYPRVGGHKNEYFKLAACVCEPEYEGPDCENEFDGCAANPCSLDRTCITLSPKDQKLLGRSYNCSACPDGYTVDGTTECSDIDECVADTDNCQHNCTNTEGGFECSCRTGYTIDSKNQSKCKDINECEEALHNCTYKCYNTDGSFTCGCFPGYIHDTDTGNCSQAEDANCSSSDVDACAETDGCTAENGESFCYCRDAYELDDSGKLCSDIDECSRDVCPHDCVNTDGSFECICYPGYRLEGKTQCEECDVLHWGENCMNNCICTGQGADRCDNVKGCVCNDGWEGDTCNIDIDECASSNQNCDDPRRQCVNNLGSYTCECKTGFTESEEGTCEDTDECSDPRLNECGQLCENTFGSYSCKCKAGYTKANETSCVDIDECQEEISQCDQICVNNPGKHSCDCNFGYSLSDDRTACIKVSDPCLEIYNLTCSQFCLVGNDSAKCACRSGYRLNADNITCTDIDECAEGITNKCDERANCINTDGSFLCECPVGMLLENDRRSCSECDNYHFGKNCLQNCSCLYGTCNKKTGCVCHKGWGGLLCDVDIDECDNGQLICLRENTVCVNTLGGARCSCRSGYSNSSGICTDINECSDISLNSCDQICNNTDGGYMCSCRQGFIEKENCEDIDECAGSHDCDQLCVNTPGSYKCSCEDGFSLDLTNRKSCKPKHQCGQDEITSCPRNSTCLRKNEEVICSCDKGFEMDNSSNVCKDIDECKQETIPCYHNCTNTEGSFTCTCNIGHFLLADSATCQECIPGKYGLDCANDCICNMTNSELCNPVSGQCDCKAGWSNETCEVDIDECQEETSCPKESICINSDGSYSCKCNGGYFKTGGGICEECDPRHFGDNCQLECTCDTENTHDCDHETGKCICKQGWTGGNCTEDVDECVLNPSVCSDKSNSLCDNNIGSYTCECDTGFVEESGNCRVCEKWKYGKRCEEVCPCVQENTETCNHLTGNCSCKAGWTDNLCQIDINECTANASICSTKANSTCQNTNGSYSCDCDDGFREQGDVCTDCKIWTFGEDCDLNCTCDTSKSEYCDPRNGRCACNPGWNGTNCEQDIDECLVDDVCPDYSSCNNTIGSFQCECNTGYYKNEEEKCQVCDKWRYGKQCKEECLCIEENTDSCDHVTGNCSCKHGWKGTTCSKDIDECTENANVCLVKANSTCENTNGSYSCNCDNGFYEQDGMCSVCDKWYYGKQCEDECICTQKSTETCDHVTGNCSCKNGWTGTSCSMDMDECTENASICSVKANSTCQNVNGSYSCDCDEGFYEQGNVCKVCKMWTFGKICEMNCTCDTSKSQYCDPRDGSCTCKPGWNGDDCVNDIDECDINDICPVNSSCNNTLGSFQCVCDTGYHKHFDDICQECSNNTYGNNCTDMCNCNSTNSKNEDQSCDKVTGECICKSNWGGKTCDEDVDECEQNKTLCKNESNKTCLNTEGWYECDCLRGFSKQSDGDCVEESGQTTQIPVDEIRLDITVTFELDLPNGTNLDAATTYENLRTKCVESLLAFLNLYMTVKVQIIVNDIRSGSVVADYTIVLGSYDSTVATQLTEAVYELQQGSYLIFDGQNVTASSDTYKDLEPCTFYNETLGGCNSGYICKVEDGLPTCILEEEGTKECSNNTYGNNCTGVCNCNGTNSENEDQSCDKATGECICKSNWGGKTCDEDVDECEQNKTLCKNESNKTCLNTEGWYECDCLRGFSKQSDGDCIEESGQTTQIPVDGLRLDITVTFELDLPNGTNLDAATTYENLRIKCVESLLAFFNLFMTVTVQIIVNDIRQGSVETNCTIVLGSNDSVVATQLTEAVNKLHQGSSVMFDGQNVTASSDTYKGLEPCTFYKEILGVCNSGYICKVEDGLPTCILEEEGTEVNWSLVIGLSAAGLFLLIITAILLVVAWRFLNRPSKSPSSAYSRRRSFGEHIHYGEEDEASGDFWRGRWQKGGLEFVGTRTPTWQSKLSRMWMPSNQGHNSSFGGTNDVSPEQRPPSSLGDRDERMY